MKTVAVLIGMVLFGFALSQSPLVHAHSETSRHGGQVVESGDLHVELLVKNGQVTVYLSDHGTPLRVTGASGRLITLGQAGRQDVELMLNADSSAFSGAVPPSLKGGDKLVVMVNLPGRKPVQARFVMR